MDTNKKAGNKFIKNLKRFGIELIAVILIIIGIILICFKNQFVGIKFVINYTDCTEPTSPAKCSEMLKVPNTCDCFIPVNITQLLEPPVHIYYELETYDQKRSGYVNSKDDNQLAGVLSPSPSPNCGEYSFVETPEGKKPIAPCGAIADSMFNDTFRIFYNRSYIQEIHTGLDGVVKDGRYHNPPGDLLQAFKNFSKPKDWVKNIWELDTTNPSNNGFENEGFIAWMNTDLKRKPAWRMNHTGPYKAGLPVGLYTLRVIYAYPFSSYSGTRNVIISNEKVVTNLGILIPGIIILVVGMVVLIGKTIFYLRTTLKK